MCRIASKDQNGKLRFSKASDELVRQVREFRRNNPALSESDRFTYRASYRRYGVLMYANIKG